MWKCKHVCIYLQAELTAIKVHSLKNWTILYRPETDEGSILDHYVAQLMNTKSTTQWHQVRTRPLESTRLQTSLCVHIKHETQLSLPQSDITSSRLNNCHTTRHKLTNQSHLAATKYRFISPHCKHPSFDTQSLLHQFFLFLGA